MMEASVRDFTDKPFCNSFDMPTGNEVTTDNLLNEMIAYKRIGGKEFFTTNTTQPRMENTTWILLW